MNYVLGFLFTPDYKNVVLLEKRKPAWQAGRLNGVGGKVEKEEFPMDAMRREFKEETGLRIVDWNFMGWMRGNDWCVYMYTAVSGFAHMVKSKTSEKVDLYDSYWEGLFDSEKAISNVGYLVAAARDSLKNTDGPKRVILEYVDDEMAIVSGTAFDFGICTRCEERKPIEELVKSLGQKQEPYKCFDCLEK